ncbi:histidine--tRNA ligase [Candidatus Woesearchaeota archaeon]|nr:histidine--tRNA ligase [Candidatus Woesearchaeota archaeon]
MTKEDKLQLARGVRDFPPEEKIVRNEVVEKLKEVFERYGYSPLETPIIERLKLLTAKAGAGEEADAAKETFTLTDQGGRKLGLRFELTLSFSRFIGMSPTLKMPFKRYELGPVFRDGPIKLGRYRQFWQCDVDVVGSKNMMTDAEIIMLALDCFKNLGLDAYLQINNRKLLRGLIESAGIESKKADSVIITLDKFEKIGKQGVVEELEDKGIEDLKIGKLLNAMNVKGTDEEKLKELKKIVTNDIGQEGLKELEEIYSFLNAEQKKNIVFNPTLARGLGYYTGPIFEGYLRKSKITSSICGGGRFDKMVSMLINSKQEYPAVGISFGLDVITDAMKLARKEERKTVTQVYIIPIGTSKEALQIALKLRKQGLNVDLDISGRGVSKNLNFANSYNIPYVLFVGEEEIKKKKVKFRDMKTGKEELIKIEDVKKKVK